MGLFLQTSEGASTANVNKSDGGKNKPEIKLTEKQKEKQPFYS